MDTQKFNLIMVILTILLTGCAVRKNNPLPSQSDIAYANYGTSKSSQDFEEKIKQTLKDPYSAQVSCSQPKKGWFRIKEQSFPNEYGYVSICQVNAKNSFGAYTGKKEHLYSLVSQVGSTAGTIGESHLSLIDDIFISKELFEFHPVP